MPHSFVHRTMAQVASVFAACLVLMSHVASAAESKSWVVSWFTNAMYSQEADCPSGLNPLSGEIYQKYFRDRGNTPAQVEAIFAGGSDGLPRDPKMREMLTKRGRIDGQPVNVYQNPTSWPDPHLKVSEGKYAYGFNLDGKGASAKTFEDPLTHEKGVNNELARAHGCTDSLRGFHLARPTNPAYTWASIVEHMPAWLITVTGEDLSKNGDVTVKFERALEHPDKDADGNIVGDRTFRIDPNPRSRNVIRGQMKDGVILTEPTDMRMVGDPFVMPEFNFRKTHLRLKLNADGALDGYLGAYVPWKPIYWVQASGGLTLETNISIDFPGYYYTLKRLADAYPDPATGENTHISATYHIEAVPAFVTQSQNVTVRKGIPLRHATAPAPDKKLIAPPVIASALVTRRLTADQYKQTIADIFGQTIKIGGRFEPDIRENGLVAIGAGKVSVTAAGIEQYDAMARSIATQVLNEQHRRMFLPCVPALATAPDDACASRFFAKIGPLLYRRPLTDVELREQVATANEATGRVKSFYTGLALSLAGMLESPDFLFRKETVEADPNQPGTYRLDDYSRAARLSFLFWNTTPDEELMRAAKDGELSRQDGLNRQVERLVASPRFENGVRAFFSDMLGFDQFSTLSKDTAIYPKFTAKAARDAQEQTLRTIVDQVLVRNGDYRDVFTTRNTFVTPTLGMIYQIPVVTHEPNGSPEHWKAYEYPEGDPRAGILMQASFVALHSHPGRSSPTLRGKALREIFLCQTVPDPPGNINFTVVQETNNPKFKTARERVTAHRSEPMCAGCHKLIDPMGLAMENFDSSGAYRTTENGAPIDSSGALDNIQFASALGLGKAVHDHPATSACLVKRAYSYALGRTPGQAEGDFAKYLEQNFAANGYRFTDLLKRIATSESFYRAVPVQLGMIEPSGASGRPIDSKGSRQ